MKKEDLPSIIRIVMDTSDEIKKIYKTQFAVEIKEDRTPVTTADKNADTIIRESLNKLFPKVPIISEETECEPFEIRKDWNEYWLVDPLDGTKEFIKKRDEFTINLAYMKNNIPQFGIVYAPILDECYYAFKNAGAYYSNSQFSDFRALEKNDQTLNKRTVVISHSHPGKYTQKYLDKETAEYGEIDLLRVGSSLKICMVAAGKAHIYPRPGPTMEWDTAAAHCVANETGTGVLNWDSGEEIIYNKADLRNPWFKVY